MTEGTIYVKNGDEWRAIYCWSDYFEDTIEPYIKRLKKENKLQKFWDSMELIDEDDDDALENNYWKEQFDNFFNDGKFKYESNYNNPTNERIKEAYEDRKEIKEDDNDYYLAFIEIK